MEHVEGTSFSNMSGHTLPQLMRRAAALVHTWAHRPACGRLLRKLAQRLWGAQVDTAERWSVPTASVITSGASVEPTEPKSHIAHIWVSLSTGTFHLSQIIG